MMVSMGVTAMFSKGLCPPPIDSRKQAFTLQAVPSCVTCKCRALDMCRISSAAASSSGSMSVVLRASKRRLLGGQGMRLNGRSSMGRLLPERKRWGLGERPNAQQTTFRARKTLKLPVKELNFTVDEYLQNVERVVKITLPDSKRIQYIGKNTWRARLKPVEFFSVSATPICDMKAWYEDCALRIFSNSLKLEFSNAGTTAEDFNLRLSLSGSLRALRPRTPSPTPQAIHNSQAPQNLVRRQPMSPNGATAPVARTSVPQPAPRPASLSNRSVGAHLNTARAGASGGDGVRLEGAVSLGLSVDLPMPLSLIPEQALTAVGDRILDSILSALQGSLLRGLLLDYAAWCRERERDPVQTGSGMREPTRS